MNTTTKRAGVLLVVLLIVAGILTYCSIPANADEGETGYTTAPVVVQTVEVEPWEAKCSPTLYEELEVLAQRDEYHVDYIYELENKVDDLQETINYDTLTISRQQRLIQRLRNKLHRR